MTHPGQQLDAEYAGAFLMSDGRIISNWEMAQILSYRQEERQRRFDKAGYCCEEGPTDAGDCREGPGRCLLFLKARQILERYQWEKNNRRN